MAVSGVKFFPDARVTFPYEYRRNLRLDSRSSDCTANSPSEVDDAECTLTDDAGPVSFHAPIPAQRKNTVREPSHRAGQRRTTGGPFRAFEYCKAHACRFAVAAFSRAAFVFRPISRQIHETHAVPEPVANSAYVSPYVIGVPCDYRRPVGEHRGTTLSIGRAGIPFPIGISFVQPATISADGRAFQKTRLDTVAGDCTRTSGVSLPLIESAQKLHGFGIRRSDGSIGLSV